MNDSLSIKEQEVARQIRVLSKTDLQLQLTREFVQHLAKVGEATYLELFVSTTARSKAVVSEIIRGQPSIFLVENTSPRTIRLHEDIPPSTLLDWLNEVEAKSIIKTLATLPKAR